MIVTLPAQLKTEWYQCVQKEILHNLSTDNAVLHIQGGAENTPIFQTLITK